MMRKVGLVVGALMAVASPSAGSAQPLSLDAVYIAEAARLTVADADGIQNRRPAFDIALTVIQAHKDDFAGAYFTSDGHLTVVLPTGRPAGKSFLAGLLPTAAEVNWATAPYSLSELEAAMFSLVPRPRTLERAAAPWSLLDWTRNRIA